MSDTGIKLVAGLGNPGLRYQATRHNAGFWLVDELARRQGGVFRADAKCNGDICRIDFSGHSLWLLKPMTFMNRSGQAIARLAGFYKINRPEILIVHDELDLPPGVVRLKRAGGHGGHNGLRDSILHLGGSDFLRLRLGIGRPDHGKDAVDYVLHRPSQGEQILIEQAIAESLREFPLVIAGQLEKAMHALHSRSVDALERTGEQE